MIQPTQTDRRGVTPHARDKRLIVVGLVSAIFCLFYGGVVISHSQSQLTNNLTTHGVTRVFHAHRQLTETQRLIDPREAPLWAELKRRYLPHLSGSGSTEHTVESWSSALSKAGIAFKSTQGVGEGSEISLVFPLLRNGTKASPVLVVGQFRMRRTWVDPHVGVIVGEIPAEWAHTPSLRLLDLRSRRW